MPIFMEAGAEHSRLDILMNHLDHMVKVIGMEHVGIGLDFDGVGEMRVEGIEDISKLPNITQAMLDRGYESDAIQKILGENFLRVLKATID